MNATYGDGSCLPPTSGKLKDQPVSERPRERLIERGANALSPAELIAILVRTGLRGTNALDIGRQMMQKFGSLFAIAQASVDDLQCIRGIGRDKAVTLVAAFTLGSKMAEELQRESPVLDNPEAVAALLREQNRVKTVETFQISTATSSGTSQTSMRGGGRGKSTVPFLRPVFGSELSSVQFRSLEEQVFRAMVALSDQQQRYGIAKLVGMRSPFSIETPIVKQMPTPKDMRDSFLTRVYKQLPFALRSTEAHKQIEARQLKITSGSMHAAETEEMPARRKIA